MWLNNIQLNCLSVFFMEHHRHQSLTSITMGYNTAMTIIDIDC
jgi:hypothetical protein